MKKLLAAILAIVMTLSFTACNKKSDSDIETLKSVWGKTPEEAAAMYGKTLDDAEFHDGSQPYYELTGVSFGDKTAKVLLYVGSNENQNGTLDYGIESAEYFIENAVKSDVVEMLKADADYVESLSGYYDAKHYSDEEWEWIERYTMFRQNEDAVQGMTLTSTNPVTLLAQEDSAVIRAQIRAELPQDDGTTTTRVYFNGTLPAMLAHKEEVEQLYPDGWEETVKAYWEEQNR